MSNSHPIKFVILTSPRNGSTWLVNLLNQVDGVCVYGELFLKRKRVAGDHRWDEEFVYPRFIEVKQQTGSIRPLSTFAYLDQLYRNPETTGFKLMYSQLVKHPELVVYFKARGLLLVHLVRHNTLDLLVSQAIKRKLQQPHVVDGKPGLDEVTVRLNTDNLLQKLQVKEKKVRRARWLVQQLGLPVFEVAYEDLLKGNDVFAELCQFLGLPPVEQMPATRMVKMRRGDLPTVVQNYKEVKALLAGTAYEPYLE